jgi:ectoine hydroxylase-related dioxygenase (phytanoyl-CoA dioxygenase family)
MSAQTELNNIQEVLAALGVTETTLTDAEKESLNEKGYVIFNNIVDPVWLKELQDKYEDLMEKEGAAAGTEVHKEVGTRRLADLVNKGEVFDRAYTHPKVLAAIYQIIGRDFKLSALNGRDAEPGQGNQQLHADWGPRVLKEPQHVAISLWMLDDFTSENGATRVVPGSHLIEGLPQDYLEDPAAPHPDEVLVTAPAGSVVVLSSHLWHGGTTNRTDKMRRAIHPYYTAREFSQQQDMKEYIRVSTYNRISPAARYILDVQE